MAKGKKIAITLFASLILIAVGVYFGRDWLQRQFFKPTGSNVEDGLSNETVQDIEVVADNLDIPWGMAFLPDGKLLVTERAGTLRQISNGQIYTIQGVEHIGEGGLLGLAVHPNFNQNHWLYLYVTTRVNGELMNRVDRYSYENNQLSNRTVILSNIPGAATHDGGALAFGPDGLLYITTGDAQNENLAQDRSSLAGKVLRITDVGQIPDDNPSGNAVYSYGHRNPQGLAWDDKGQLWASEHGRSGTRSGFDEINLIKNGANYGWPIIEGDKTAQGMQLPIVQSGASETWAPASLAYKGGSLFFGGLRGQSLYQAVIRDDGKLDLRAHFRSNYGRIRGVVVSPDGHLYIATSNKDGRGDVSPGDDKILKINPKIFGL